MSETKTCPTCGAPLPSDATGGACPKCLLQAGFATGGSSPPAGDHVPTPEELAPHFPGLVIEDLLGRGGMGVVYRARHKALDREVALKVLPERVAQDRAFADRFQREARALAKLQHPNIVAVHDFGTTDGLFWLVMEYVDGANIRQAMRAGQIGPKEALAIVPQICDALQYAHEHGVVHRDIKPENVLLDKAGHVKVADFGLAKLMEHDAADPTLTGAGQVMGTPHYMAPEQWEKPTTVDHRADIYSLGVVFYEMLTGELPVGRFAAPSKKSDVDARIDEIVLRTLEREREARYQQVSEVKTDMGRASVAAAPAAARDASLKLSVGVEPWRADRATAAAVGVWTLLLGVLAWIVWDAKPVMLTIVAAGLALLGWAGYRRLRPTADGGAPAPLPTPVLVALALLLGGISIWALSTLRGQFDRTLVGGTLIGAAIKLYLLARARTRAPKPPGPGLPAWAVVVLAIVGVGFLGVAGLFLVTTGSPDREIQRDALKLATEQLRAQRESDVRSRDFEAVNVVGGPMQVAADDRERIAWLWQRVQRLPATASVEQTTDLYPWYDRPSLAERLADARAGDRGLPLILADRLPAPLTQLRLERVVFEPGPPVSMGARALATDGTHDVWFRFRRDFVGTAADGKVGQWFFDTTPVVVAQRSDTPSVAAIAHEAARLLDALRQIKTPRGLQWTYDLYASTAHVAGKSFGKSEDGWLVPGKEGSFGLPLTSDETLGGRLADFWIDDVLSRQGGARAVVTLRNPARRYTVVFQIAREEDGSWRFTNDRVEVRGH